MNGSLFSGFFVLLFAGAIFSATDPYPDSTAKYLRLWQESRIGMFICLEPSSLIGAKDGGWNRSPLNRAQWDTLYKVFNPTGFTASEWVTLAKDFGAKYINFLTKHHDGFCMFDSKATTYDIMSSPFGRDMAKEVADECRRQGIRFDAYYSIWDMYQPDWQPAATAYGGPGYSLSGRQPAMDYYITYMKSQLREIVTSCNPGVIWFDGCWFNTYTCCYPDSIYSYCKTLRPGLLVNDRVSALGGALGDYWTPECKVGSYDTVHFWETCATLKRGEWFYGTPAITVSPTGDYVYELIQALSGDGNYLLNLAPGPDGHALAQEAQKFREIGAWVHGHSDGLYATRGGPYLPGLWGGATKAGNKIYLHIPYFPLGDRFILPPLQQTITSGRRLGAGGQVTVSQTPSFISLTMPQAGRDTLAETIELTLDSPCTGLITTAVDGAGFSLGLHGQMLLDSISYTASSFDSAMSVNRANLLTGSGAGFEYTFATRNESNPYIIIDVAKVRKIYGLEIINSFNLDLYDRLAKTQYLDRAKTIAVWTSTDGATWTKAWQADRARLVWAVLLGTTSGGTTTEGADIRYIKIGLQETGVLMLKSVRVFGQSEYIKLNDTDPGIVYSTAASWNYSGGRGYGDYRDDLHYTTVDGSCFEYTFSGIGIDYISEKNSDIGQADVYIDGVLQTTVNAAATPRQAQQVLYHKDLVQGTHAIRVVKRSGTYLCLDALRIRIDPSLAPVKHTGFPAVSRSIVIGAVKNIINALTDRAVLFTIKNVPAGMKKSFVDLYALNGVKVGTVMSENSSARVLSWDLVNRPLPTGMYAYAMTLDLGNARFVKAGQLHVVR